MIASATSNFISITDPISARVAGSRSRGWMHSTDIVSVRSFYQTHSPLNTLQYVQKEDRTVRRPKMKLKPVAPPILLGSALEIQWDPVPQTLREASSRWT